MEKLIQRLTVVETEIKHIKKFIEEIKDNHLPSIYKKLNGRPAWSVSIIITLLTSTCVGLIVRTLLIK